ncbi:hypothetical protein [Agrobacterium vaccinii]|uniref:hypothetical protein n=1 Tax=Agrobacterium vaccinii TaxID=2735528 RepID=UPI001E37A131|nr:hypothetical protein [Agrobacterium vaccinii]UHS59749.1 hypothetical protein HRS00_22735 [Agrobacterium vaccinii]
MSVINVISAAIGILGAISAFFMIYRRHILTEVTFISAVGAVIGIFQAAHYLEIDHTTYGIIRNIGFSTVMLAVAYTGLKPASRP